MDMWMPGVPVDYSRPFQRPADIAFDADHDIECQPFRGTEHGMQEKWSLPA